MEIAVKDCTFLSVVTKSTIIFLIGTVSAALRSYNEIVDGIDLNQI